jgi:hypothetical protein
MSEQATGGIISAWLRSAAAGWANDDRGHDLGSAAVGDLIVKAVKEASGAVVIEVDGPLGRTFTFRRPLPPCDSRGLLVAVAWNQSAVHLYLNGKRAEQRRVMATS